MLQFLKENSYHIVKCLLNQIAMTMFGLMLTLATDQNETFLLIGSIMAIGLYLVITYYMFWEIGGKDRIHEDTGRRRPTPLRAVFITLTANIPNIVFAVVMLLTKTAAQTSEAAGNAYAVCNVLARGLEAMYLGIIHLYFPDSVVIFLVIILPVILTAWLAYFLGHRNFRIAGIFGIKQNTKEETR